jgi:hypothetical protein
MSENEQNRNGKRINGREKRVIIRKSGRQK